MTGPDPIDEYIDSLRRSPRLGRQVVYQNTLPARKAEISPLEPTVSGALAKMLAGLKVSGLYSHQRNAIEALRRGGHVVVATPTASGKTMVYNIPFFEKVLVRPSARAIYLFPLKALAQDQLKSFREMAGLLPGAPVTAAVYDGDTSAWHRKKIRTAPPSAVLTNPEMLHLSLLPFHEKWRLVFENLEMVVVDEVHTYRGVLGSHMAQIFRRLARVCGHYGSRPQFVFCSATIANPEKFCEDLVSFPVCSETRSGASAGKRHFVFINPEDSPAHTAILLLKAARHRGLRTIV
jgi:DEAD/DEAH box helicase domain-containing protein